MSRIRARIVAVLIACLALGMVGCGAKPVPTKGVVLLDGKPLANANVLFVSQEPKGVDATGFTDTRGVFELTTSHLKDGAMPGLYKITIHPSEKVEVAPSKRAEDYQKATIEAPRTASVVLPEIYTRVDQTPLQHRVPSEADAKFELRSDP